MLADSDVQALLQARHPDPFAVLGLHADAAGALWLRVMLPGALAVAAVAVADAAGSGGRRVADLALRHPDGVWEARLHAANSASTTACRCAGPMAARAAMPTRMPSTH